MTLAGLSLAVLGCGRITELVHFAVLQRLPGVRVVAVADADPARLRGALARVPGARGYDDWRDALAAGDADGVLVALPNDMHAEAAVAVLRSGRHLYLEKPLATTCDEGAAVVAAAVSSDRVAMVGFNHRFHPLQQRARALVRDGVLGEIRSATMAAGVAAGELGEWKRTRAGSVLPDLGSHAVDRVRHLLAEEIAAVSAGGDHDRAWMMLTTGRGVQVAVTVDRCAAPHDVVELHGDRGSLRFDRLRGVDVQVSGRRPALAPVRRLRRLRNPHFEPSYDRALRAFADAARGGATDPAATVADGHRAVLVIAAAERSRDEDSRAIASA